MRPPSSSRAARSGSFSSLSQLAAKRCRPPERLTSNTRTRSARRRRSANSNAAADETSIQWASSIASSTGAGLSSESSVESSCAPTANALARAGSPGGGKSEAAPSAPVEPAAIAQATICEITPNSRLVSVSSALTSSVTTSSARARKWRRNAVLPMPGSPSMARICAPESRTEASTSERSSSSDWRPTNGPSVAAMFRAITLELMPRSGAYHTPPDTSRHSAAVDYAVESFTAPERRPPRPSRSPEAARPSGCSAARRRFGAEARRSIGRDVLGSRFRSPQRRLRHFSREALVPSRARDVSIPQQRALLSRKNGLTIGYNVLRGET